MNTFKFDLPENLIARYPHKKRDDANMLQYSMQSKSFLDLKFSDIVNHYDEGDVVVVNSAKVNHARFNWKYKNKLEELVFIQCVSNEKSSSTWEVLLCLLYTSPSPRDRTRSRMPSSA